MKTMALTGLRRMELREAVEPEIRSDSDVKIRVKAVGVCGSDVHYYNKGKIGDQVVQYPFVAGHECAGVVEETGAAVRRIKPGDRVAVDPAISCGQCDQCKNGRRNIFVIISTCGLSATISPEKYSIHRWSR